jgi:hypothetical protein
MLSNCSVEVATFLPVGIWTVLSCKTGWWNLKAKLFNIEIAPSRLVSANFNVIFVSNM